MLPNPVFDLISAETPYSEDNEEYLLYSPLIGSWKIDCRWYLPDGNVNTATGEWHFQWILGGCGVQNVLFRSGAPSYQFGTTLRCYDQKEKVWHVSWMQPCDGEFVNLIGRKVGDRIVQEGVGTDPTRRERWSFTEIKEKSFLWLGEVSFDNGKTWRLEQEMRGTR